MMRKSLLAFGLAVFAVGGSAANTPQSDSELMRFRTYLAGLPLGELKLAIEQTDGRYEAQANFKMTALLRLFIDTDASASVAGHVTQEGPRPVRFEYFVRDRKKRQNTEILFDEAGNVASLNANPPFRKKSYDMTLGQAAGAVDPATAVLMLAAPRSEPCSFEMDVFDGKKRHRIRLIESVSKGDDEITCLGQYDRIAGFKAKHMTPERRTYPFKATLFETAEGEWRPRRVWAETKFGPAVVRRLK